MDINLKIEGMTCGGCKAAVERILTAQSGIQTASVDLTNGTAFITTDADVWPQTLADALTAAGYTARVTS